MTDVATSLRRQKSTHPQPVVNICGDFHGTRVEVFGEELGVFPFKEAHLQYDIARLAAAKALLMLNRTLGKEG